MSGRNYPRELFEREMERLGHKPSPATSLEAPAWSLNADELETIQQIIVGIDPYDEGITLSDILEALHQEVFVDACCLLTEEGAEELKRKLRVLWLRPEEDEEV